MKRLNLSERRVCCLLGQGRSAQRKKMKTKDDEQAFREELIKPACDYGRYGYRRITVLLMNQGWKVNHKKSKEDMETGRTKGTAEAAKEEEIMAE